MLSSEHATNSVLAFADNHERINAAGPAFDAALKAAGVPHQVTARNPSSGGVGDRDAGWFRTKA